MKMHAATPQCAPGMARFFSDHGIGRARTEKRQARGSFFLGLLEHGGTGPWIDREEMHAPVNQKLCAKRRTGAIIVKGHEGERLRFHHLAAEYNRAGCLLGGEKIN